MEINEVSSLQKGRDWRSKKQIDLELHNDGRNTPQIILKYKVKKLPDTKRQLVKCPELIESKELQSNQQKFLAEGVIYADIANIR